MSITDLRVGRCGCCAPIAPMTPLPLGGRPGLPAVPYRAGTWATFRRTMLDGITPIAERLAVEEGLAAIPLDDWTTDADDDYGRVLLGLWASVLDVLTFHTERYAQEAWLRTATDPASIRRLAALLGHRPSPGASATAHVLATLEADTELVLPAGMRIQSTPADGESPQVFETSAALDATSTLDGVPVFAVPSTVIPLAAGRDRVTLAGGAPPLPGERVLLFGDSTVDEREVAEVRTVDGRAVVHWTRPLEHPATEAWTADRSFRLAGADAPASWIVTEPAAEGSNFLSVQRLDLTTDVTGTTVQLGGAVSLEAGSSVLVVDGATGSAVRRAITHVEPGTWADAGMTIDATDLTLSSGIVGDLRTTRVHELLGRLLPASWELADGIGAGTEELVVPHGVTGLTRGRRVALVDDEGPVLAVLAADGVPYSPPGVTGGAPFVRIRLTAKLPRALAPDVRLHGNLAAVGHGETVAREVLGDGDRAAAFQEFELAKTPLTHVVDPTSDGGVRPEIEVLVGDVRWHRRDRLFGAAPDERAYEVLHGPDGTPVVRFGDGRIGARLPSGRANVVATYRQGLGTVGRVAAGQLETALDRPTGLDRVANPLPATGGSDPEGPEDVRDRAPASVRTFDRAVSLLDLADLSLELPTVSRAHAGWVWDGVERVVALTVAGPEATVLSASDRADLQVFLDARRDVNRSLRILDAELVPLEVLVEVDADPDRLASDVREAVVAELLADLAPAARGLAQPVNLSDTYAAIHRAAGVVAARIARLRERDLADRIRHGVTTPTRPRLRLSGATPDTTVDGGIRGAELGSLSEAGIALTVVGGLPDPEVTT